MTRDQFSKALDRYGGNLRKWPAALRREAEALVAGDSEAAAALKTAQRLDSLLAEATMPEAENAAQIGRIVSRQFRNHGETVLQPTRRLAGWASAAMAATLMIGFAAGALVPPDESDDTIAALLFSDTEEHIGGDLL